MSLSDVRRVLLSKKVVVSLVSIVALTVMVLAGTDLETLKWAGGVIAAIAGSLNLGQGLADGLSEGRTSAGARFTRLMEGLETERR